MLNQFDIPGNLADRVTQLGGLNRFNQPNFRLVWGGKRTHLVGGFFKEVIEGKPFDIPQVRTLLKYHPHRFHLERWVAPEKYGSPEAWYESTWDDLAQVHTCGPYPSEGDFEHVFFLAQCTHMYADEAAFLAQHPLPRRSAFLDFGLYTQAVVAWQEERMRAGIGEWCKYCQLTCGEFIPLEENFHLIEMQIQAFKLSDLTTECQRREAHFAEQHAKRLESRNRAETIVRNRMMEFGTIPHSYVTDAARRCSVPDARFNPRLYQPLGRSGFRQSTRALPNQKQQELEKN